MVHPKDEIKWWNPNNYTVYAVTESPTTIATETEQAFGLSELRDKGAITTQTKENLIFLVAALPRETRRNLSYTLNEFVLRCSFNSKDCNMERDFKLHVDPEYGNCYTFNFNDSVELKNSRAGPMYGLRLLLDVHQNDYMPTTEAAGVRLVVHEQDQEPFPDTFGYSAPTGFVSSFGLKTKVLYRLQDGQCSDTFRPDPYIYDEHYSPEGCHRNCFQLKVLDLCGCGDPRFPLPGEDYRYCSAKSIIDRNNCPAVIDIFNDSKACTEYYRVNTAYIEIYYEQLNFETLKETSGYTLVIYI
uniref:Amiloride-sensitive sodium channel n=1 Tax=Heterorhabditis bacteriophora TaxID=37862 RepID=A0A1I7X9K4_HETBA